MFQSIPLKALRHTKVSSQRIGSCRRELAKLHTAGTCPSFTEKFRPPLPTLAPTSKSLYSPLHQASSANIASKRSEAISRHLSTGTQPQPSTMSYGKGSEFGHRQIAPKHTLDYRCYVEKDGVPLSPFHDVPLYANEQQTILNMVVEIPRWTNAKLEVGQEFYPRHVRLTVPRSRKKNSSILSSKTSRRASFDLFATASHTKAISGTTVPSQECVLETPIILYAHSVRHGKTPTSSTPRPRLRVTTTHSMSARLASLLATLVRSSKSRF